MNFLATQYGYRADDVYTKAKAEIDDTEADSTEAEAEIDDTETDEKQSRLQDFVSAYCSAKKDRNGDDFVNPETGEPWKDADKEATDILSVLKKTPFADVEADEKISIAYNFGIINGKSDTLFDPQGEITREEAATMLMRVYRSYGGETPELADFVFDDDENISDWAKNDVYSAYALGIMNGVADGYFAPQEKYTVEQSIITFFRLYDKAPVSRKNENVEGLVASED